MAEGTTSDEHTMEADWRSYFQDRGQVTGPIPRYGLSQTVNIELFDPFVTKGNEIRFVAAVDRAIINQVPRINELLNRLDKAQMKYEGCATRIYRRYYEAHNLTPLVSQNVTLKLPITETVWLMVERYLQDRARADRFSQRITVLYPCSDTDEDQCERSRYAGKIKERGTTRGEMFSLLIIPAFASSLTINRELWWFPLTKPRW